MTALAVNSADLRLVDLRRKLIANGYSPIPVDGKRPRVPGWQDLKPDATRVEEFIRKYPDHQSTGLLTGDLVAIDVDVLDPTLSRRISDLVAALPGAEQALCRVGRAPKSLFVFRTSTPGKKRVTQKYLLGGETAQVEILGLGQQFVGFGLHPDTRLAYEWIGDSPLDIAFGDLPEITTETIDAFLNDVEAALASAGELLHAPKAQPQAYQVVDGSSPWERVNAAALLNLDAWVPRLGLAGLKRYRAGYLAVASFRPSKRAGLADSARQAALEFQAEGICDHGDGDRGYSAVSMVGECLRMKPADALVWLCEALGIQPETIGWESAWATMPRASSNLPETLIAVNDNQQMVDDEIEPPDFVLDAISLENLSHPGGLIEDMIDWIVSSAEQPSRTLALAAVIPLVAAVAGSRYSTGDRDTRPNIYTVALARSGFGKEHARSQIKRLLMESQGVLDKFGGPARIMSASALREVLEANPSVNCQIDEFGGFIRDITDRNAGGHQRAISTDLRDYYSASVTYFEGAAYRGSPPKRIYNPNLCIHGTSTPEQFWSALSSASAEDGLLPRLVLFHVDQEKAPPVKPPRNVRWVPTKLLERLADVAGIDVSTERLGGLRQRGNVGAALDKTPRPNRPKVVEWTEEALVLFDLIKQTVDDREQMASVEQQPFVRRILENAVKLALIVAVGTDPVAPEITERDIEWGASVAWSCAATMLEQVNDRLADNQREANYKRIAGLIRGAGAAGITIGRVVDRLKSIDARQREEIIKDLRASGKVSDLTKPTKGRPQARLVWTEAAA